VWERAALFWLGALRCTEETGVIPGPIIDYRLVALLWLAVYVTFFALVSALTWHYRQSVEGDERPLLSRLRSWRHWGALGDGAWFISGVGLPYAAVVSGVIGSRDMGLVGIDWLSAIGRGIGWGTASFALLVFSWWRYTRAVEEDASALITLSLGSRGLAYRLARSVAHEALWAFYRGVSVPWLGQYTGPYAALLMAIAVPCLSPWTRAGLRQVGRRDVLLLDASLAVVSTTCYVLTSSLWICLALHVMLTTASAVLFPAMLRSRRDST
jgi:hypothetical protein